MKNIKWIFFDIGYTLVNEDLIWQNRINETLKIAEKEGISTTYDDIYNAILNAAKIFQPQAKTSAKTIGVSKLADYCPEYEMLYDDARSVLEKLKEKYKIGVIANQCENLIGRLTKLNIIDCFDLVVSSHDVKLEKPDIRIFELALKQANCMAENAVMIGERIDNDIIPANKLGMKTIHILQGFGKNQISYNEISTPTYNVNNLTELLNIFE